MKEDKEINCAGANGEKCTNIFTWTVGDQEFYEKKGFQPPRRCESCRRAKRPYNGSEQRPSEVRPYRGLDDESDSARFNN